MSTTPVTPAAPVSTTLGPGLPKETAIQKVETIFTNIGKVIQGTENAIINIGVANKNLLTQFLPPAIADPVNSALNLAANTFAAMEAQEQTIGSGKLPYAAKVAIIVATQGATIAGILAKAGLASAATDIQNIVSTATGVGAINFAAITQAPVAQTSAQAA